MLDNSETVLHMYDSAYTATEKQSRVINISSWLIALVNSYPLAFQYLNIS